MIKSGETLGQVKRHISDMREKPVEVTVNLGRNKFLVYAGRLMGVYPALFTVTPFDKDFRGKTSYSYSEYMCGKVKVKVTKESG